MIVIRVFVCASIVAWWLFFISSTAGNNALPGWADVVLTLPMLAMAVVSAWRGSE